MTIDDQAACFTCRREPDEKRGALSNRDLDERVNGAKAESLHAYGLPAFWLCVSPVECQALLAGVVSTEIRRQAERLVAPDVELSDEVRELHRSGETGAWHPRVKVTV